MQMFVNNAIHNLELNDTIEVTYFNKMFLKNVL